MTKYYDPETVGFYDDAIHTKIPKSAITISEESYEILYAAINDGYKLSVVDGIIVPEKVENNISSVLENLKQNVNDTIDSRIEVLTRPAKFSILSEDVWNELDKDLQTDIAKLFSSSVENIDSYFNQTKTRVSKSVVALLSLGLYTLEKIEVCKSVSDLYEVYNNFQLEVEKI